jgi:hypothetical protein
MEKGAILNNFYKSFLKQDTLFLNHNACISENEIIIVLKYGLFFLLLYIY